MGSNKEAMIAKYGEEKYRELRRKAGKARWEKYKDADRLRKIGFAGDPEKARKAGRKGASAKKQKNRL